MATLNAPPSTNARVGYNAEHAGHYIAAVADFNIATDNAGVAIATADIVRMVKLPPGCVVVDCILDTDVNASGVVDVGLDGGAEFITGLATSSTAKLTRLTVAGGTRVAPSTSQQYVTATFTTGGGATSGTFRLTVMYRAEDFGI